MSRLRAARLCALALGAVLLAGCLDFETVTAPVVQARPAQVHLSANRRDFEPGGNPPTPHTWVTANVFLGNDARGEPRALTNDTLWVLHTPVLPRNANPHGHHVYDLGLHGEPPPRVSFTLPRIGGVTEAPPELEWHPLRKLGPDTLRLPRGSDLVLRIAADPERPIAHDEDWSLGLLVGTGGVYFSSVGATPDSIVIAAPLLAAILPPTSPARVSATLHSFQRYSFQSAQRDLEFTAGFSSHVAWVIELTDAAPAP